MDKHNHDGYDSSGVLLMGMTLAAMVLPSSVLAMETEATQPTTPRYLAQVRPVPEAPFPELGDPQPLPPPEELLDPRPGEETDESLDRLDGTLEVRGYRVEGSTRFTPEDFVPILEPFIGQMSFADLLQARSAITRFYVERGYITSGALLPPQTIEDGIVTIQVVEGALEDIVVTGDRRLKPEYVRSRLNLAAQTPLNIDDLLEALQLLQLDPLIENLSAELSASPRPGFNLLEVEISEAPSFRPLLRIDSGRSPTVGAYRGTVELREANLTGWGDRARLSYSGTEGSHELQAGYRLPINPRNGTLETSLRVTGSEIIERPFDELNLTADSRDFELTYRQPLHRSPGEEFALGLTFSRRESETSLLEEPFPLSVGANEKGETRLSVFRFFQEWTQRGSQEVLAARSQFNWGIPLFGNDTINSREPDGRFFNWRGQAQYLRLLSPDGTSLLLRSDVQLSATSMVPLERFGLGGNFSVRGYSQDFLLADSGLFASAEVRFPIWTANAGENRLELRPFVDVGTVWNQGDSSIDTNTLASLGLGVHVGLGDRFSAKLDWGIPLVSVEERENRDLFQRQELYFQLEWQPF
ncbi:MAG: ShlB/FhaC/HecB family hemolysin secretion/activation protein [Phormidium sp. BM_Day4_Bin.17]|nr:ShlB/FhaC/HecB family hemolysin secretion/activation protein [Phormidium sp. BM_Day4_Bin.17]UCJ11802.1 MAG: ShlB/FhaC/HecB family hemolysin secretion/activation protein [Phormidium sp. PBR-2020]